MGDGWKRKGRRQKPEDGRQMMEDERQKMEDEYRRWKTKGGRQKMEVLLRVIRTHTDETSYLSSVHAT